MKASRHAVAYFTFALVAQQGIAAQSLFCFTVYRHNTGTTKRNYDLDLLQMQHAKGEGIFGCDTWAVYSDVRQMLAPGIETIKVDDLDGDIHVAKVRSTQEWLNTGLFFQVWKKLRDQESHTSHDWVVKVDPKTVFIPFRLKAHLAGRAVPANGVYLKTCDSKQPFLGSLEVFSIYAFNVLLMNLESCKVTLPWLHNSMWEDLVAMRCMDLNGVDSMDAVGLAQDGVCAAKQGKTWRPSPSDCNAKAAAFYPFKMPTNFKACAKTALDKGANRRLSIDAAPPAEGADFAGAGVVSSPVVV
jgi:hypothetical protein